MTCSAATALILVLSVVSTPEANPPQAELLYVLTARTDELVNCVQKCPIPLDSKADKKPFQDYLKDKKLSAREFFLGEALYLMKLHDVVDLREYYCRSFWGLMSFQRSWSPELEVSAPDPVRIQTNRIIAYFLMNEYGGVPEAYRLFLLGSLLFHSPTDATNIDAFLADCAPLRSPLLDTNLVRALLNYPPDKYPGALVTACESKILVPDSLPHDFMRFLWGLPSPSVAGEYNAAISAYVHALISKNSPALDVAAAFLICMYGTVIPRDVEWLAFMMKRAPGEFRTEYLLRTCINDPLKTSVWEEQAKIFKEAMDLHVGGFPVIHYSEPDIRALRAVIDKNESGKNDLGQLIMSLFGSQWGAKCTDLREKSACRKYLRSLAQDDGTLYYALLAIRSYVSDYLGEKDPEAERVIGDILDRAMSSEDKNIVGLAARIKDDAFAYRRSSEWSFAEHIETKSGIALVDYIHKNGRWWNLPAMTP